LISGWIGIAISDRWFNLYNWQVLSFVHLRFKAFFRRMSLICVSALFYLQGNTEIYTFFWDLNPFWNPGATLLTIRLNSQKLFILRTPCINGFLADCVTDGDYFTLNHEVICCQNRDVTFSLNVFMLPVHQTTTALNKIQFVTKTNLLHVSALGCPLLIPGTAVILFNIATLWSYAYLLTYYLLTYYLLTVLTLFTYLLSYFLTYFTYFTYLLLTYLLYLLIYLLTYYLLTLLTYYLLTLLTYYLLIYFTYLFTYLPIIYLLYLLIIYLLYLLNYLTYFTYYLLTYFNYLFTYCTYLITLLTYYLLTNLLT